MDSEKSGFKVTLESLYTRKIKEISFDEEESYQEKPTLPQKLTELAQRVDFSDRAGEEGSEPAPKKPVQRWPWEVANSKLRQALTEVSVLSDVIQIAQYQKKYVALDPVMTTPSGSASPAYQYLAKKKALGLAAQILQKGAKSLSLSSTEKEREFHKVLSSLRQRWRLKRIGSGAILGDLSFCSAGSTYSGAVSFDVVKCRPKDGAAVVSSATAGQQQNGAAKTAESAGDVITVTIPRELRGRSEILVFLSAQPVQETPPLSAFPPPLSEQQLLELRRAMSSVDAKLSSAQNLLFNQEVFAHLAREAYDHKPELQHEVFTNKINIPLSLDCWLSVMHVKEYDDPPSSSSSFSSSSFPPVRWDLVVALKQLLRANHRRQALLVKPRPSTAGFLEEPEVRNAGAIPLKDHNLIKLEAQYKSKELIFKKFVDKARHIYNAERLQEWVEELCGGSEDPSLQVVWKPSPSFTLTSADLVASDSLASAQSQRYNVKLTLKVEEVTVERAKECGGQITFQLQREQLLRVLKHEIVFQRMKLAKKLAEEHKWEVSQELPHPLQPRMLAKQLREGEGEGGDQHPEMSSLLLNSSDRQCKMELLFQWKDFIASVSTLRASPGNSGGGGGGGDEGGGEKWETTCLTTKDLSGANSREKITSLLTSHSSQSSNF